MKKDSGASFARLVAPYRGLGGSLWSMFFATMINRFGDFVGAFLALYLSRILGFDASRAGAMVSVVFAASALGAFVSGRIADAVGRKRTLMICQAVGAATNLAASFVFRESWAPWLIALGSLFRGGARPLIGAILADLAPTGRRKEVFGLQYWSINVGVALGPLVAAFLFDHATAWLFRGDAVCTALAVLLIGKGVHMPVAPRAALGLEQRDERGALRAFLARPILLAFALLAFLSSLTYSQTGFALPLTVSAALGAAGPGFLALLMTENALLVLLFSIPLARALRARSPLECMTLSGVFYIFGFGMLALPLGRAWLIAATAIWTLGEIISSVNMGVFLAKHSPENWRGSFQSFMGVFYQGAWAIGPLLAGPLARKAGMSALWAATAALCAVWALGAVFLERWDRRLGAEC